VKKRSAIPDSAPRTSPDAAPAVKGFFWGCEVLLADADSFTATPELFAVGVVTSVVVPCRLVEAPEEPAVSLDLVIMDIVDDTSEDAVDVAAADINVEEAEARETGPSATGFLKVFGTQIFILFSASMQLSYFLLQHQANASSITTIHLKTHKFQKVMQNSLAPPFSQ